MGPDLQIFYNSSHHLLVSSPEMILWVGTYFMLATDVAVFLLLRKLHTPARNAGHSYRRSIVLTIPIVVACIEIFAMGWTNTLDINWDTGAMTSTDRFVLGFERRHTMAVSDVDQAFIDHDRMGPLVVLRLKNGTSILPLGRISMDKQSQRTVVETINDGLEQHARAQPGDANPGFNMDSSVDKALREEQDFKQQLQQKEQKKH